MYDNNQTRNDIRSNSIKYKNAEMRKRQIIKRKRVLRRKKIRRMKYILTVSTFLVLILCVIAIIKQIIPVSSKDTSSIQSANAVVHEDTTAQAKITPKTNNTLTQASDWNLLVVNSFNPLEKEITFTKVSLTNGEQVDQRIYDSLMEMLEDGKDAGLSFVVCSGYRSIQTQTSLFQDKVKGLQDEGMSYSDAYDLAATEIAIPGTSEHHIGLAVDIVSYAYQLLDDAQANTPEAKWLKKNCYKYGFILRYPDNKQAITNIISEPWHFRYVGIEAATEIMSTNICLEEYVEQLSSE